MILMGILQYIILILCRKLRSLAGCFGLYFYWSIPLTFVNIFSISLLSLRFLFLILIPWACSYFLTICAKKLRFQELLKINLYYENSVAKNAGLVYAVPHPHRNVLCYTALSVTPSKSDHSQDSEDENSYAADTKEENKNLMETEDSKIPCPETGELPIDKVSKEGHSSSPKSERKRKSNPVHDLAKRQRSFDGLQSDHNLKEKRKLDFDIEDNGGSSKMDCTEKTPDDLGVPSSSRGLNQKEVSSSSGKKEQSDSSQKFWKGRKNHNLPEKFLKNYGDLSRSGLGYHGDPSDSSQIEQDKLSSVYSTYHKDYSKDTIIAPDDNLEPMNLKVQDNRLKQHGNKQKQSSTACPKKNYLQQLDGLALKLYESRCAPKNAEKPNASSQPIGSRTRKNNMYARPNELRHSSLNISHFQQLKETPGFISQSQQIQSGYYECDVMSTEYQTMLHESLKERRRLEKSLKLKTSDGSCVQSANASATATSLSPGDKKDGESTVKVPVDRERPMNSCVPPEYLEVPGLAESSGVVKKDAFHQKRFYRRDFGRAGSVFLSRDELKLIRSGTKSWYWDDVAKKICWISAEKVKQGKNKSDSQKSDENSSNAPSVNKDIVSPIKSHSYCSSSENSSNREEEQKESVPRNVLSLTLPSEVVNVPKKDEKNAEEPIDNVSQEPACSEDPKVSDLQPEIKDLSTPCSPDNEHGLSSSESLPPGCETSTSQSFSESPEKFRSELSSTEERPFSDIKDEIQDDSTPSSSEIDEPKILPFEYEKQMPHYSKLLENLSHFSCTEELQISDLQPECKDISTPCSPEVELEAPLSGYGKPISKKNSSESPGKSVSKATCTEQPQISDFPHDFTYETPPCSPVIEHKNPLSGNEKPKSQNYSESSKNPFSEPPSIKDPRISNIQHRFKDDATQCSPEINSEDSETSRSLKMSTRKVYSDYEMENPPDSESIFPSSHEDVRMYQAKEMKKLLQGFLDCRGTESFKNVDESQLMEMDSEESQSPESAIDPMDADMKSKNGANSPGCSSSSSEEVDSESHLNHNIKTEVFEDTRPLESPPH